MSKPPVLARLRAASAYKNFTGKAPDSSFTVQLDDDPVAGYRLGSLLGVAYEANRDGQTERYFHEYKKSARPDLVAKDDGSRLYITRGNYRVTERGIEDKMPPLMILNPSKRPSQRKSVKKGKPTMARRRLAALMPRRRRKASARVINFLSNPVKRVRRRRRASTYRRNPIFAAPRTKHRRRAAVRRSYRRNPIGGAGALRITSLILPAAGIGLGAIGSEMAMGYLPIPAQFKTGVMRHVTKGVVSLAAGWALSKFANKRLGEAFALGGLTIAFHDAFKEGIVKFMPSAQFGQYMPTRGMGYYSPGSTVHMMQGALPRNGGSVGGPNTMGMYMKRSGMAGDHGRASDGYESGSPQFGV